MRLKASNTFTGTLTLDGGTLEISGVNTYTGSTTVYAGSLVVRTPTGALGNATTAIAIGNTGTFGEPDAALLIDGAFTIGRNVMLTAGADPKTLGGKNIGAGATFAGNVTLNATASNVRLHAENTADEVTFSGAITGGGAGKTLTKTGAGTVVFSGGGKTYLNDTIISEGTLQMAQSMTLKSLQIGAGATGELRPVTLPALDDGAFTAGLAVPASTAVPEPASTLLLAASALCFTLRRRR